MRATPARTDTPERLQMAPRRKPTPEIATGLLTDEAAEAHGITDDVDSPEDTADTPEETTADAVPTDDAEADVEDAAEVENDAPEADAVTGEDLYAPLKNRWL